MRSEAMMDRILALTPVLAMAPGYIVGFILTYPIARRCRWTAMNRPEAWIWIFPIGVSSLFWGAIMAYGIYHFIR